MVSAEVIAKLPAVLKPVSDEQDGNAAVSLLLKPRQGDVDLLLVKRVENPSDTWSGQMALPGGKREMKDLSLKDTAVRETLEETGIAFTESQVLGVLNVLRSEPRSDLKILPLVVLLKDEPRLKLNKEELETFVWVPYEKVVQNKGTVQFSFGKVSAYIFAEGIVWGITYNILTEFIQAVEATQNMY